MEKYFYFFLGQLFFDNPKNFKNFDFVGPRIKIRRIRRPKRQRVSIDRNVSPQARGSSRSGEHTFPPQRSKLRTMRRSSIVHVDRLGIFPGIWNPMIPKNHLSIVLFLCYFYEFLSTRYFPLKRGRSYNTVIYPAHNVSRTSKRPSSSLSSARQKFTRASLFSGER